ncbi:putative mucin/carbohydrate-binding domain-containing protein [Pseudomonas atagonensis]|uniref:putative mucin/carbohydrate-binding domain-containing protein n=1 Tax=Pseudomonas atagonensis TaxID=2609964 RepID=UPI00140DAB36|nr:putative mucin/carbohydrate-binding domain-containing protein [Pseudomonas atagonensis]
MADLQYANRKPVVPLYKAVGNEGLTSIKTLLNTTSQTALFDCFELKQTGLTGNLELVLSQEIYENLKYQDILLKNGSSLSNIINISQPTTVLPELPIGTYTLQFPTTTNGKHSINKPYVTIKSGTTTQPLIKYEHRVGCELASQKINMGGLNGVFATIRVDTARSNIHVNVSSTAPHSYFPGRLFASITIKDRDQRIVFFKEMPGTDTKLSSDSIPYGPGYTLELFNEEPSRLTMSRSEKLILDTNAKHQHLSLTPQGLYNKKLSTPTGDNLEIKIEQAAFSFNQEKHQLLYNKHPIKDEIFLAIDTFNEPRRTQLFEKYSTLNPFNNLQPAALTGQKLKWELKGLSYTIAQIDIDLTLQKIDVRAYRQKPHGYFNSIYLALWVVTKEGTIRLCQEYRGNVLCEDYSASLPFRPGDEIRILHLEPSRSLLTDTQTKKLIPVNQIQVLRVQADNQLALMMPSLD